MRPGATASAHNPGRCADVNTETFKRYLSASCELPGLLPRRDYVEHTCNGGRKRANRFAEASKRKVLQWAENCAQYGSLESCTGMGRVRAILPNGRKGSATVDPMTGSQKTWAQREGKDTAFERALCSGSMTINGVRRKCDTLQSTIAAAGAWARRIRAVAVAASARPANAISGSSGSRERGAHRGGSDVNERVKMRTRAAAMPRGSSGCNAHSADEQTGTGAADAEISRRTQKYRGRRTCPTQRASMEKMHHKHEQPPHPHESLLQKAGWASPTPPPHDGLLDKMGLGRLTGRISALGAHGEPPKEDHGLKQKLSGVFHQEEKKEEARVFSIKSNRYAYSRTAAGLVHEHTHRDGSAAGKLAHRVERERRCTTLGMYRVLIQTWKSIQFGWIERQSRDGVIAPTALCKIETVFWEPRGAKICADLLFEAFEYMTRWNFVRIPSRRDGDIDGGVEGGKEDE
ncbi:hypothetical protein C8R47DRAFT_1071011 [Mycena vitilis]|nr:hypothetical protein C8R47DRAFT_1071011 [Mycena vitilis]